LIAESPALAPASALVSASAGCPFRASLAAERAGVSVCWPDVPVALLLRAPPAQRWKGIGAFDAAKLAVYRGGDLVRLGQHAEAQAQLHAALEELDPALVKHRCTAHIDLAEAYVSDHKPAEGAHHAASALQIITGTRRIHSLRRVEAIYTAVKPSGAAEARELGTSLLAFRAAS
jgi:hypothetical protein